MLITHNKDISNIEFETLLSMTIKGLQKEAKTNKEQYLNLLGVKLEKAVYDIMCEQSRHTPFEDTIELISGFKFPDIIANNFYGVEVKSTKQNHWTTTGNSILENTRIEDIQKIYMLFGKLHTPIEFKFRLYEECLSDVIVTHSPRYAVNMNLKKGKTIFDKISVEYDNIRTASNPFKPFKDYYRKKLKSGQELWWIDEQEYKPDSIIFRIWNTIPKQEKDKLRIQGYAYFPEILGRKQIKFDRFTLWLSIRKRIICPNIRDLFTAGGQGNIQIENITLTKVPKVLIRFFTNIDVIITELINSEIDDINYIWKTNYSSKAKIYNKWVKDIVKSASMNYAFNDFKFELWLHKLINENLKQ
jgi:hypothetical protein